MISIVGFGRPKFGASAAASTATPAAKATTKKVTKCKTCGK
jgi:hypothetical protein